MSLTLNTTAQQVAQNRAAIESRLNQNTPVQDRAFNTVLATEEAMMYTALVKYGVDRSLAALAISATGVDLDWIGSEYGVYRNPATGAIITATLPATDATIIPLGTKFTGANGLQYQTLAAVTAPSGVSGSGANLTLRCLGTGSMSTPLVGSGLTIVSQIAGASALTTVSDVTTVGVDADTDTVFRPVVLSAIRATPGGGNLSDYRTWGLSAAGVLNVYPYSGMQFPALYTGTDPYGIQLVQILGAPTGGTFVLAYNAQVTTALAYNASAATIQTALRLLTGASLCVVNVVPMGFVVTGLTTSAPIYASTNGLTGGTTPYVLIYPNEPPLRTVFVESKADTDGIANATVLAAVTSALTTDPGTGLSRQAAGQTSTTLLVLPIFRTQIFVQLTSLAVPSGNVAGCQADILSALQTFLAAVTPYISGLDATASRNDTMTNPVLSKVVQKVVDAYGATVQGVAFGLATGSFVGIYQVSPGEKTKLGGVAYV